MTRQEINDRYNSSPKGQKTIRAYLNDPAHREMARLRATKWYAENRPRALRNAKKYREENPDKARQAVQSWKKKYPARFTEAARKYRRKRRSLDPLFRVICALRHRVWSAVSRPHKQSTTFQLLGCSQLELKAHLERRFQSGMSWDNYGQWHIDHVKPCSKFDLTCLSQQRECFHYTNLQPLWAVDNIRKGAK